MGARSKQLSYELSKSETAPHLRSRVSSPIRPLAVVATTPTIRPGRRGQRVNPIFSYSLSVGAARSATLSKIFT